MKQENGTGQILEAIHVLSSRMDEFVVGQKELRGEMKEMGGSIKSLEIGQKSLEEGQREIHEMIQEFSTQVDERFDQVDRRFERVDQRFDRLESRVGKIEATMVTKDYLDDKLAEHGSRYGDQVRKTNLKIGILTDSLVTEGTLSSKSAKRVLSAEPFARAK